MGESSRSAPPGGGRGFANRLANALRSLNLRAVARRLDQAESAVRDIEVRDRDRAEQIEQAFARLDKAERGLASTHHGVVGLQTETERLRDQVVPAQQERCDRIESDQGRHLEQVAALGRRLDLSEEAARASDSEIAYVREQLLPAAVARCDALLERISDELEELASLVERMLLAEPLPCGRAEATADQVAEGSADRVAEGLAAVQPLLVDAFRGSSEEIKNRLACHLESLTAHAPVLDLGAGRGELLLLLRSAGVSATGIEGDPALAQAARRRGLRIIEGDVLAVLPDQPPDSWGAVTAFHLLEHLTPPTLLQTLQEIRRVLVPGGLLLIECPNPHTLRVGASLYWLDPTHQRPLLPETLGLFLSASGFAVESPRLLHPFPAEQLLARARRDLPEGSGPELQAIQTQLDDLRRSLDEMLSGPRDFAIQARKPQTQGGQKTCGELLP